MNVESRELQSLIIRLGRMWQLAAVWPCVFLLHTYLRRPQVRHVFTYGDGFTD